MKLQRILSNLCSDDLKKSAAFYTSLFDFTVNYDSDWFVHLVSKESGLELGIILRDHQIVPEALPKSSGQSHSGIYLTFVVEDSEVIYQQAVTMGYDILEKPTDTFYGQKRLLLLAPEGTICDISSLI